MEKGGVVEYVEKEKDNGGEIGVEKWAHEWAVFGVGGGKGWCGEVGGSWDW